MWFPPVWRTVPGARRYAVSDTGLVRNGRGLLVPQPNDEGYLKAKLVCDDGVRRGFFIHKLVALAHLAPPLPGQVYVLHRSGCRSNNRAANLRWGTHLDNHDDKRAHGTIRPVQRKLAPKDVMAIRRSRRGVAVLASERGLSVSHVREIRSGRKWGKLGRL